MSEDLLLEEAIAHIENGDPEKAREVLSRLLKTDPQNATYWVWMSVVSATRKEKIYCLQTAIRLEPENEAARRGLVLLGEREAADVPPFPMQHGIAWQTGARRPAQEEEETPTGWRGLLQNRALRPVFIGGGLLLLAIIVFAVLSRPQIGQLQIAPSLTPVVSLTPSPTSTPTRIASNAIPTAIGNVPLAEVFGVQYTPTPLYVQAEHDAQTREIYRAAITEYGRGNFDLAVTYFTQLTEYDPQALDGYYYLGESYRQKGDYEQALLAYNQALEVDRTFGPAYLGRALALRALNPKANVLDDLLSATEYAPDFINAWLALAEYRLDNNRLEQAAEAIAQAETLSPENAEVHLLKARLALAQEDYETALTEARTARDLNVTLLDAYFLLGKLYYQNGDPAAAFEPLRIYTNYVQDNAEAWALLSFAWSAQGNAGEALKAANTAIELDSRLGIAYHARGLAYLQLGEGNEAEYNLKTALQFFPRSFEITLNLAHAYAAQGKDGEAYQQVERTKPLAKTDEQMVQYHYWRAYYLEKIDRHDLALSSWQALLEYPQEIVPADWLAAARENATE